MVLNTTHSTERYNASHYFLLAFSNSLLLYCKALRQRTVQYLHNTEPTVHTYRSPIVSTARTLQTETAYNINRHNIKEGTMGNAKYLIVLNINFKKIGM